MTPAQFADLFERFFFEFRPRVPKPEDFLSQRTGDYDDYAVLGSHVLELKGWLDPRESNKLSGQT